MVTEQSGLREIWPLTDFSVMTSSCLSTERGTEITSTLVYR